MRNFCGHVGTNMRRFYAPVDSKMRMVVDMWVQHMRLTVLSQTSQINLHKPHTQLIYNKKILFPSNFDYTKKIIK